jgi:hypothetical protein
MASGLQVALDLYTAAGISPKILTDNITTVSFDLGDAAGVVYERLTESDYIQRHQID